MTDSSVVDYVSPQLVPVNPEVYASYLCHHCFTDLPIEQVTNHIQSFLLAERGLLRTQKIRWHHDGCYDPFQFLEHSVKYLRGRYAHPPFECATFTLHDRYIKGHPPITFRGHLALITFE